MVLPITQNNVQLWLNTIAKSNFDIHKNALKLRICEIQADLAEEHLDGAEVRRQVLMEEWRKMTNETLRG